MTEERKKEIANMILYSKAFPVSVAAEMLAAIDSRDATIKNLNGQIDTLRQLRELDAGRVMELEKENRWRSMPKAKDPWNGG